ncbi:hypothetical protein Cpir12675_003595 [Ceratocystis pirilliformis]|uniref:Glycoside hydrolase family 93 protein n=1 Tax=Ceratocystis pirilliformis TaxID=259994 RepID=A0ABR3Z1V6_9PEZI
MLFTLTLALTSACGLAVASPAPSRVITKQAATPTMSNIVIFSPPSNANWTDPEVLYARAIQLESGAILSTWENYSPEPPLVHFPIYKSLDSGATWKEISQVHDTVNGWGLRYQPDLFQLPARVGKYPAGTIILAGNSIPTDLSKTKLDIYASTDEGVTWEFVSTLGEGGEARPVNGLTPIWEPLVLYIDGAIAIYYSDQRDPSYGQKLVHTTSTNLVDWTPLVDDVHVEGDYESRPGMPALAKMPNGKWIFAYETCRTGDGCNVSYRIADTPYTVLDAPGQLLKTTTGATLTSSPAITWSPVGGANGTIILSSGAQAQVFTNQMLGAADAWVARDVPNPSAYSRWVKVMEKDPSKLIIVGGGWLPPANGNKITYSVVDINALISS